MASVFECVPNKNFNESIFNRVFDHCAAFAIDYSNRVTPELKRMKDYNYRAHWERVYKEEQEMQDNSFFIELFEIHEEEKTAVGYFIVKIKDKTLVSNVALSGRRKSGSRTVTNVGAWIALFELTKSLGCNEFVWETDRHGRVWKALHVIANRLDNEISFKEGDPYSEMRIKVS